MGSHIIAISIGNTRTHFGLFIDGELQEEVHLSNEALQKLDKILSGYAEKLEAYPDAVVAIASVCEPSLPKIMEIVQNTLELEIILVEKEWPVAIARQLDPETLTGSDRLLNACAAWQETQQACIVIDAGTAVTVDFIDGEGVFHGGAILPGAQSMLNTLTRSASALPEIDYTQPEHPIGGSTVQAMLSGVHHAIYGGARALVEAYALGYGAWPKVIATGGDAETLFKDDELVESIVPNLTLLGIEATIRLHRELDDGSASSEN